MDEDLVDVFLLELRQQSMNGVAAAHLVNSALAQLDQLAVRMSHDKKAYDHAYGTIWMAISAILTAGANASKILWPTANRQRSELVDVVGLTRDSALADRLFRNHFEHIDERIEAWWASSPNRNYLHTHIGSPTDIMGLDEEDMFRSFDPQTSIVTFRGDIVGLQDVVTELEQIRNAADRWTADFRQRRTGFP